MNCLNIAKYLTFSVVVSTSLFAENSAPITFSATEFELQSTQHLVDLNCSDFTLTRNDESDDFATRAKLRKRAAFLLTGVIVHQASRAIGYTGIALSVGAMVIGGGITAGPAGVGAAYLTALTMVGPASAAVETGSLAIGVAASFIPCLP